MIRWLKAIFKTAPIDPVDPPGSSINGRPFSAVTQNGLLAAHVDKCGGLKGKCR